MMIRDDELVSVDHREVSNVLLTQALDALRLVGTKGVAPLAGDSELAVPLDEVQTEVGLGAGGGVPAGAVRTVAFVVVRADLEGKQQTRSEAAQSAISPSPPLLHHHQQQQTHLREQPGIVLQ